MAAPRAKTRTFKGGTGITDANAGNNLAVAVTTLVDPFSDMPTVNTVATDGAPLKGACVGKDGDEVSVADMGEFEIAMKAAVVTADLNKGVVNSDTAGLGKSVDSGGLGEIIGGRDAGSGATPRYFATIRK